jgi:hypothetical protein
MAVHGPRLKLIQVSSQQLQALGGVVITIEPEAAVAGVVVAGVEVLRGVGGCEESAAVCGCVSGCEGGEVCGADWVDVCVLP